MWTRLAVYQNTNGGKNGALSKIAVFFGFCFRGKVRSNGFVITIVQCTIIKKGTHLGVDDSLDYAEE